MLVKSAYSSSYTGYLLVFHPFIYFHLAFAILLYLHVTLCVFSVNFFQLNKILSCSASDLANDISYLVSSLSRSPPSY